MPENLPMTRFEDYAKKYRNVRMERRDGVLQLTLHTDGGPAIWDERIHRDLPQVWADVAADRENRAVILTGTGEYFLGEIAMHEFRSLQDGASDIMTTPLGYHKQVYEGTKLLTNYLDIQVPVIAAVNGPATVHSELAVMADIVIASENATFADQVHFWNGIVPGDGIQLVWQLLLGPNRGRYFLLTGEQLSAHEALELNVVSEVLAPEDLLARAWEIAEEIARRPTLAIFYTKYLLVAELRRLINEHAYTGLVLEGAATVDNGGQDMGLHRRTTTIDPAIGFNRNR